MADKQSSKSSTGGNKTSPTPAAKKRRQIKEVTTKLKNLTPKATAEVVNEVVTDQVSKQFGGFTDFLREQSVIGIGIGLVLGTQLKLVVDSITLGFVLPLTQLFLPNQKTLTQQVVNVNFGYRSVEVKWGEIAYTLFNFLVVAFIVYAVFKLFKLDRLTKKKEK